MSRHLENRHRTRGSQQRRAERPEPRRPLERRNEETLRKREQRFETKVTTMMSTISTAKEPVPTAAKESHWLYGTSVNRTCSITWSWGSSPDNWERSREVPVMPAQTGDSGRQSMPTRLEQTPPKDGQSSCRLLRRELVSGRSPQLKSGVSPRMVALLRLFACSSDLYALGAAHMYRCQGNP